jgi:PHD/YefM family antitoxin component YafN of YafNO toxin-antitoxin module
MENTSPKKFRAELRDYLDLAAKEPIRIQRRSGESYILMAEATFAEMQNEVLSLQRRLLGMTEALEGKGQEYQPGKGERQKRFKKAKTAGRRSA